MNTTPDTATSDTPPEAIVSQLEAVIDAKLQLIGEMWPKNIYRRQPYTLWRQVIDYWREVLAGGDSLPTRARHLSQIEAAVDAFRDGTVMGALREFKSQR